MHKSLGNGVDPSEMFDKYGADLVRLWAASADFRLDMRASDAIFKQLSDKYLKIRNTARYILGNLDGFDPETDTVALEDMIELDRWALDRCAVMIEKCLASYEKNEFWQATYAVHNFCVVDMSNVYLDVIKDRLYCEGRKSLARRSAQTAIWLILDAMVRLLAPVLSFTANEIWTMMPHRATDDARHVMLNDMPSNHAEWMLDEEKRYYWDESIRLRTDVNKALELARAEKIVGKPLDAKLTIHVSEAAEAAVRRIKSQHFEAFFIVSEVEFTEGAGEGWAGTEFEGVNIEVKPSDKPKCVRCWTHSATVGENAEHPELCARCAKALAE